MIETYKLINGLYNVNEKEYLTTSKDSRTRGHCYKLVKQACRLDIRKHFFSQRVVDTWNSLPESTVTAVSLNAFKNQIDKHLKEHTYSPDFPLKPVLQRSQVGEI